MHTERGIWILCVGCIEVLSLFVNKKQKPLGFSAIKRFVAPWGILHALACGIFPLSLNYQPDNKKIVNQGFMSNMVILEQMQYYTSTIQSSYSLWAM